MVTIRLTNSKTRRKEEFRPIDPSNVRMYVCGPTVYDRAHLGNARPVVVFDTLYRLLRHVYGEGHVTYVRNFTDVDDKINAEALRRQKAGAPGTLEELIHQRTEETIAWYHADMDALGALRPSIRGVVSEKAAPRATGYIAEMIDMINLLIASKHAYVVRENTNNPPQEYVLFDREAYEQGHALFDVESYANYGKFSGRSLEDMIAGARGEKAPHKRNPQDFVLWKPSSGEEPGWQSPWGKGRPGWHIECSAMAHELLGESFDIHGGGLDLQFPHHENEIAQSACAHPHGDFAHYWLHNEMLQVEGKKMSKSLGNFFTVRDLLDQGIPGEVIRFVFLRTHYRKPMDWTAEGAREARVELSKWWAATENVSSGVVSPGIVEALSDDLNTHGAITALRKLYKEGSFPALKASAQLLGLQTEEVRWPYDQSLQAQSHRNSNTFGRATVALSGIEERLASLRTAAMATKDFSAVDALKGALIAAGVEVRMSKAGVELVPGPDFDPAKLEALQ
jgi:cysteinyl-tRNA synthetase